MLPSLDLQTLSNCYAEDRLTPLELVEELAKRCEPLRDAGIFIGEPCLELARASARTAIQLRTQGQRLPLYGIPFAIKDNIDLAGVPTTAACPAFAYVPETSARVVVRLMQAGAIPIGKTNLDQFATGLVGVRSPYGIPRNPFDRDYIAGGSSSGSAVAVARGLCSFALGTDTAGSGRVPAALNNLVGLKPSAGMLSAAGVVPACRSLDCVSVFALTVDDAAEVAAAAAGYDAADPYARRDANGWDPRPGLMPEGLRVALPEAAALAFDDAESAGLFAGAVAALERLGAEPHSIAFAPFAEAGGLLYGGPWVAERLEAAAELLARAPDTLHPAVRAIFAGAARYDAKAAFDGQHRLARLRSEVDALFERLDCLMLPATPGVFRVEEVLSDPLALNQRLGLYANFVNLLDLCALAIPAGFRGSGLPFGVTLIARRGRDALLASVGRGLQRALVTTLGATGQPLPAERAIGPRAHERAALAVVGAHLGGQPLNRELTDLGARLVCATRTVPRYRLFALPTTPKKPGLVRSSASGEGRAIEVEVWELSNEALGRFMRGVRAPLCIGTLELEDGSSVHGFLCESDAVRGAREITSFGGWRAYLREAG